MSSLRDHLVIFEHFAERESNLAQKELLQVLCSGYAAAAKGWKFLAEGEGDETKILEQLVEAGSRLAGNVKKQKGGQKKLPANPDMVVLDRYFNRDPLDIPLRYFVEAAFDEGILDRKINVDVHVTRMQRFLDRALGFQ
jgi:hypothetical protein